jgi:glycine/D-amino acid oxidase-like deaminating enzyme
MLALNSRIHRAAAWLRQEAPDSDAQPTHLRLEAAGRITDAALARIARTLTRCRLDHQERILSRTSTVGGRGLRELLVPTHVINPYRTVLALASVARRLRVEIHEWSPVASVEEGNDGVRITTADGRSSRAGVAVISTNAYTAGLGLPAGVRARAKSVYNYMIATPELTPRQQEHIAADLPFVVELNKAYVFYRRYAERLLFGGIDKLSQSGDDDFAVPAGVLAALRRQLAASFPGCGLSVAEAWGGRFHMSLTDMPQIERRGRIVMNVGYGGTGVALALVCADLAAALARGGSHHDSDDGRLLAAIVGTRLPVVDGLRFAGGVAAALLRPGRTAAG